MLSRMTVLEWFSAPWSGGAAITLVGAAILVVAALVVLAMYWGETLRLGSIFDWKRRRAQAAPAAPAKPLRRAQRRAQALPKS